MGEEWNEVKAARIDNWWRGLEPWQREAFMDRPAGVPLESWMVDVIAVMPHQVDDPMPIEMDGPEEPPTWIFMPPTLQDYIDQRRQTRDGR